MGSMIQLSVGRLEIDWGKNFRYSDHSELFQTCDLAQVPYYYVMLRSLEELEFIKGMTHGLESLFLKSSGGDFRRHTWSLAPSDPSHHEPTSGQLHPGQRTCHRPLYVLGKTTAAPHPREGSLHYPTT